MSNSPFDPPQSDIRTSGGVTRVSPAEADRIAKKIKKLNRISLGLAIPGIALQAMGQAYPLLNIPGLILVLFGFGYYAKMKGRSPVWCLMAFFSCIGLIVLAVLPKYCHHCEQATGRQKNCQHCHAPAPL